MSVVPRPNFMNSRFMRNTTSLSISSSVYTHSSYSEGDHCPLSLSEGPKTRTFFSVKGRRPALYFTVSLSEGPQARTFFSVIPQRPALYFTVSLSDSSKPALYFTVPLNEMQLVRTVTQWAAPKPATSIIVECLPADVCLSVGLFDCRVSI